MASSRRLEPPVMAEEAITATAGLTPSPLKPTGRQVYSRKIAVMGYPCVGKSSITLRFVNGQFPDAYDTTIEDLFSKNYAYKGRDYALRITDTAGQQEYSIFPRSCSVDIDGFILVYAIDDRKSFEIIQTIHDKIVESVGDRSVPVVVVANKLDLQYQCRAVTREEGEALAKQWSAGFIEISAKDLSTSKSKDNDTAIQKRQYINEIFEQMLFAIEKAKGNMDSHGRLIGASKDTGKCSLM